MSVPKAIRRTLPATTAVILLVLAAVGCSSPSGPDARVKSPDPRLTGAEWDYGASFKRDAPGVTFQPDVVIPGGGAASVVGVSGDGLTWTLRGDAPEVNDLKPGKLLLVTNRGAGRVLAVDRNADGNVAVTIGPADLTDYVRDIDTKWNGALDPALTQIRAAPTLPSSADVTNRNNDAAPVDANGGGGENSGGAGTTAPGGRPATTNPGAPSGSTGPTAAPTPTEKDRTPAPQPPSSTAGGNLRSTGPAENSAATATATVADPTPVAATSGPPVLSSAAMHGAPLPGGDERALASLRQAEALLLPRQSQSGQAQDRGTLPPVSTDPLPVVPVSGMTAYPLHGSDGSWGVELQYNRNGLNIRGSARVYIQKPSVNFALVIRDGKIVTAEAEISGVAGVRATFDAATETGLQANIHQIVDLPLDISVPIFGPLLPFAVNFHQSFKIDTVFSAKNSSLSFNGDYALQGSLRAGYRDGSFGISAPSGLSVKKSLLQTTKGASIGVNGFIIAHKLQMTIGIGGFGFAVGPYVSLTTAMSVVNGSDLGIVKCKGGTLNLDMGYGIGYVIPTAVVTVINFFLRALNLGEIKATGGTKPITTHLATLQGYAPKLKICEGAV